MKKKFLFIITAFVIGFASIINNVTAVEFTPDLDANLPFHTGVLDTTVQKDMNVANTQFKYVHDYGKGRSAVAYCIKAGAGLPKEASTVGRREDVTDPRLLYILQHGYHYSKGIVYKGDLNDLTDHQAYYVTQLAVWFYLGPNNGGYDASLAKFRNSTNALTKRALALYDASANASAATANPYIKNAVGSYQLKYDRANKRYISEPMHVTGYNIERYTISLSNAPAGTKLVKADGGEIANGSTLEFKGNEYSQTNGVYYLVVPESSVKANIDNLNLTLSAETYIDRVYKYTSNSEPNSQPLVILIPTNYVVSDSVNYKIVYENKSCESEVAELLKKYPNLNVTIEDAQGSAYLRELATLRSKYPEINTDAGAHKPSCSAPKCDSVLNYLFEKYPDKTKGKKGQAFIHHVDQLKDKYGINVDAGYDKKPVCEDVVTYLKNKYSNRTSSNTEYVNELNKLKEKYGIYTDQGIENPSCEPAPGKPSCQAEKDKLYQKYPNPADRNNNNSLYIQDVNNIIKLGQENGWKFYTDDIAYPDCVKHYKREIIIRKVIKGTDTDLAGATLVLTNASGEKIAEWVTDGTGKVFTDLPAGSYTVTETAAPEGYNLGNSITFEIKADQDEYSLMFKVEDSPIPNTANLNFTLIITAFILFLGFGIFGLIKTSQREDM